MQAAHPERSRKSGARAERAPASRKARPPLQRRRGTARSAHEHHRARLDGSGRLVDYQPATLQAAHFVTKPLSRALDSAFAGKF